LLYTTMISSPFKIYWLENTQTWRVELKMPLNLFKLWLQKINWIVNLRFFIILRKDLHSTALLDKSILKSVKSCLVKQSWIRSFKQMEFLENLDWLMLSLAQTISMLSFRITTIIFLKSKYCKAAGIKQYKSLTSLQRQLDLSVFYIKTHISETSKTSISKSNPNSQRETIKMKMST